MGLSSIGKLMMNRFEIKKSTSRPFEIYITDTHFIISGYFNYLNDKEVIRSKSGYDEVKLDAFMGMNYYSSRSYKKCIRFVILGVFLELLYFLSKFLLSVNRKANILLALFGEHYDFSEWICGILFCFVVIVLSYGVALLFSKKKMIEISFYGKRFCVKRKYLSDAEFMGIYNAIKKRRANIGLT